MSSCRTLLSTSGPFVEPLANLLGENGLRVWYDDQVLELGDSIREGIDEGLRESPFGLVVLSPAFLEGRTWTERELSGLFSTGKRVVPVFYNVSLPQVAAYSPIVADRRGLVASEMFMDRMANMVAALAIPGVLEE